MNGTKYYPLFSWDAGIRSVRVSYSDKPLGDMILDVKIRVFFQANTCCEARRVGVIKK